MRTVLRLLRLQIDNKTDLLKAATPKRMIASAVKVIFTLALAFWILNAALSNIFMLGFSINAELLTVMIVVTQLISVSFAIGRVINTLYLSPDNEILICLPTTPNQLFASKLLLVYLTEVAANAMISIPLFLSLGTLAYGGFALSYYLLLPLMLLILPLPPIILAAFLSLPIMRVIRFLKKHTLLSVVVIFGFIAACLWGYLLLLGGIAEEFDVTNNQLATVKRVDAAIAALGSSIPLYHQLARAMLDFSFWYYIVLFVAVFGVLFLLTFLFTRYFFFKLSMSSLEKTIKSRKKERRYRKRGRFASLLLKEFLCVFRSSSNVFEYFLFTILMPFIVFSYDRLLMSITVNQAGVNMIAGAHVMVVAILAMLSNISSASAISRDGGNFYTSKIVPVGYYTQIFAKFTFNAIFTMAAILVTALISLLIYPAWQILLGSAAVAMTAIGHIAYCIDTDIKSPTISMQGDEESSSVSKATPKALISGLIIGFILGLTVILMSSLENQYLPYYIIMGAAFLFMVYRVYTLILRINLTYEKIEM